MLTDSILKTGALSLSFLVGSYLYRQYNSNSYSQQRKQCKVLTDYLHRMKELDGIKFKKAEALDRIAHLQMFHRHCKCFFM